MAGLLQELENNEAILLLYLADELPAEDRSELEAMLATDAGLAADLDRLRALEREVSAAMQQVDATEPLRAQEARVRQVAREMRRRELELRARSVAVETASARRRWPGWAYPAAAAAAVVFLLIGLWGVGVIEFPGQEQWAGNPGPEDETPVAMDRMADELQRSFEGGLDDAERRMRALQGEYDDVLLSLAISKDEIPL